MPRELQKTTSNDFVSGGKFPLSLPPGRQAYEIYKQCCRDLWDNAPPMSYEAWVHESNRLCPSRSAS